MILSMPKFQEDFFEEILDIIGPELVSTAVGVVGNSTDLDITCQEVIQIFTKLDSARHYCRIGGSIPQDLFDTLYRTVNIIRMDYPQDIIAVKLINGGYYAFIGTFGIVPSDYTQLYMILNGGDAQRIFKLLDSQAMQYLEEVPPSPVPGSSNLNPNS